MQCITLPSADTQSSKPRVVHILSGDRWAGAEVQAFTLLTELKQHTQLHVIVMNDGELAKRCRSLGIHTEVLDEDRLSSVQLFFAICRYLKKTRPDVVHTHRQKENIFGSVANLITCRAKCIRTVHGAPEFSPRGKQKLQVWLDTFCGQYLQDAIIAVSAEMQHTLSRAFSQGKVHFIANGINPVEVRTGLVVPDFRRNAPNTTHIGLVGRLDPVKRIDLFLEMAAILLRERPNIQWAFHVFGEGPRKGVMQQLSNTLGLSLHATFHGHRADIRSCIAGLNAVVMPSDHEGLPMAALETLALGVRLVAHNTGGLRELLKSETDCLVTDHSARGYANALSRVLFENKPPASLKAGYVVSPDYLASTDYFANTDYLASENGKKTLSLYQATLRLLN